MCVKVINGMVNSVNLIRLQEQQSDLGLHYLYTQIYLSMELLVPHVPNSAIYFF